MDNLGRLFTSVAHKHIVQNADCAGDFQSPSHMKRHRVYVPRKSADYIYNENLKEGLQISALTHDGLKSSSHAKGMKDAALASGHDAPESHYCRVHLSCGARWKAYAINLSELANPGWNKQA